MAKVLWLLLLVPLSFYPKEESVENHIMPPKPLDPQAIEKTRSVGIALDLHGVLFKFDYGGAVSLALSYGTVVAIVQHLFGLKGLAISLAPILLPMAYGTVTYGWFFLKHGFVPTIEHQVFGGTGLIMWALRKTWLWLASLYYPQTDLIDLIWSLKKRGFKIILASNIGPQALEELKKYHPEAFVRNGELLFDKIWIPCARNGWITKPHEDFLEDLQKECQTTWPEMKTLIFVDNRKRNLKTTIKSETQLFYIPILFSGTTNLMKKLESFKIM